MNTGGPAFPQPNHLIDTDRGREEARGWMADSGMTLLDWMAGQALAGYVANNGVSGFLHHHARDCYELASAMLAEKARREGDHSPDAGKMAALEAANRELVEALDAIEMWVPTDCENPIVASARAILAKHKTTQ